MKEESLILSTKKYAHTLTNISEAKEHSTNGGFLCEEKQAIQTSNDISEAHEAFYKSTKDYLIPSWCIKEKGKIKMKDAPRI